MRCASSARRSMCSASSSSMRSMSPRSLSMSSATRLRFRGKVAYGEHDVQAAKLLDQLGRDRTVGIYERVRHLAPRLVQHVVDVDLAPPKGMRNAPEHIGDVGVRD